MTPKYLVALLIVSVMGGPTNVMAQTTATLTGQVADTQGRPRLQGTGRDRILQYLVDLVCHQCRRDGAGHLKAHERPRSSPVWARDFWTLLPKPLYGVITNHTSSFFHPAKNPLSPKTQSGKPQENYASHKGCHSPLL